MEISREAQERLARALGGQADGVDATASTAAADQTGNVEDAPTLVRVARLIERISGVEADGIEAGTLLTDDLHLPSLTMIEIAVNLEDEFRVRLGEDDIWSARSVGDLVATVEAGADAGMQAATQ